MNKVLVTVSSTQAEGIESLSQEYRRMPGQYYEKGGARYLVYEEPEGESGRAARVVLCLRTDPALTLQITRKGESRTQITLVPGRETAGIFETPFGNIPLRVATRSLEILEETWERATGEDTQMSLPEDAAQSRMSEDAAQGRMREDTAQGRMREDAGGTCFFRIAGEYVLTMRMTEGQETDVTSRITVLVEDGGAEG